MRNIKGAQSSIDLIFHSTMESENSFNGDERLEVIGRIFQSVGISAVIWGVDALALHSISAVNQVIRFTLFIDNRETI
jgi:hypothetical protein